MKRKGGSEILPLLFTLTVSYQDTFIIAKKFFA